MSKSIKKKLGLFILNLLLILLAIIPAFSLLFISPTVQTISAKLATYLLSENLQQKIEIERIQLGMFSGVHIEGLRLFDDHDQVLIGIDRLSATPVFADIIHNKLYFKSARLEGAVFNMGTYSDDTVSNLNMFVASIIPERDTANTERSAFKLQIEHVSIMNGHFSLFDEENISNLNNTIDYDQIVVDSIFFDADQFTIVNDSLHFLINSLSAIEKSGAKVQQLKADFFISSKGLVAKDASIKMGNSEINADFALHTNSYKTYSSFIDSVVMSALFKPSIINLADIGYFSEVMYQMPNTIGVTGYAEGTVANLKGRNLKIKYGANTRVSGQFSIKGLPDFYGSYMEADSLSVHLTTGDLLSFQLPISKKQVDFTSYYAAENSLTIQGEFRGYYEDFTAKLQIGTPVGEVATELSFLNRSGDTVGFDLKAKADSIDLGYLFHQEEVIGKSTFNITAIAGGRDLDRLKVNSSGLIKNTRLLDYTYKRVKYSATYMGDSVILTTRFGDPNLMMSVKANVQSIAQQKVNLAVSVEKADLRKLNLLSTPSIVLSTKLNARVEGASLDSFLAEAWLQNTTLFHLDKEYLIDSIRLNKGFDSTGITLLSFKSEVADAQISGRFNVSTIGLTLQEFINSYYQFSSDEIDSVTGNENLHLDLIVKKPEIFQDLFLNGLNISSRTTLSGDLNFVDDQVSLQGFSPFMSFQGIKLDSNVVSVEKVNKKLLAEVSTLRVVLKDSTAEDNTVFGIDDMSLSAKMGKDSIVFGVYWNNRDTIYKNIGEIEGFIATSNDTTTMNIGKTNVVINDSLWEVDSTNLITSISDRLLFRNLNIYGGHSVFKLHGVIPQFETDSLVAQFLNWDLSNFDIITRQFDVNLNGAINGDLQLTMIKNNPTLVSDLTIDDLWFNGEFLGKARLLNTWDNSTNAIFLKTQIIREGNVGVGEVFSADGYYYPFKKEDNLNVKIGFNRIKLKVLEPFLSDFVNQIEGTTSGNLVISGSVKNPVVEGAAKLQRTSMVVNYLNTRYSFSNSIGFEANAVSFNNLILYDTIGNQADVSGKLMHDHFRNPIFDVEVNTNKLLFFNTTKHMNDLYYGTAIASGKIAMRGSPDNILLTIDSQTRKGTFVTLPLTSSGEISDKDYIVFVSATDSLVEAEARAMVEEKKRNKSKFDIQIGLRVNSEAGVAINLPSDMGNIEARGKGDLNMRANSDGEFTLAGDYVVEDGTFLFTIGNLVNKRFSLVKGGRISWTGSPYTANVNIRGLYRVKTSLQSLGIVIDSSAAYKNKTTVNCYIVLTNELLNPDIKFQISLPDLDPDLQRVVYASLDTTNAAMMNQQMISLLVLGSFSFNNASNINLAGSYYGIIANQLSSMLSQISDDFDIGVNYKPGDAVSQEEFEVALSTQLFDDRLTIDGNFGMTYDRSQQSASNLVGDINIGYKLTPEGRWVLKVFNHSNVNSYYNSTNYDQISPYTQGVGIAFRKEFNNISELFVNPRRRDRLEKEAEKQNVSPKDDRK